MFDTVKNTIVVWVRDHIKNLRRTSCSMFVSPPNLAASPPSWHPPSTSLTSVHLLGPISVLSSIPIPEVYCIVQTLVRLPSTRIASSLLSSCQTHLPGAEFISPSLPAPGPWYKPSRPLLKPPHPLGPSSFRTIVQCRNPSRPVLPWILNQSGHYWNRALCLVSTALGKQQKTLGKPFAECHTRQS